jgi:hypothetical protein
MKKQTIQSVVSLLLTGLFVHVHFMANSFCGFYVAQPGAQLFNDESAVILARYGETTTVTMSSDVRGDARNFAMVVPVPEVLSREQIKLGNAALFQRFDQYSTPRLVEYYDPNPCQSRILTTDVVYELEEELTTDRVVRRTSKNKSVKVEARYEVGEYDILILSATESNGLKRWLNQHQYDIPKNAEEVLDPYIKDGLKFFVVKVNLKRMRRNADLRPIQITYNSSRFMLPIRLGMANADGDQDMIVYTLSSKGRVESSNYRTIEIPTNRNIPVRIKNRFNQFYREVFDETWKSSGKDAVITEYAWNITPNWGGVKCDPCSGNPPMHNELIQAGATWIMKREPVYFTRLHIRYNRKTFPQDLQFIETSNTKHFQGRYIVTHPATGDLSCEDGKKYLLNLKKRQKKEEAQYALLTGRAIQPTGSGQQKDKGMGIPLNIVGPNINNGLKLMVIVLGIAAVVLLISGVNRLSELKTLS